MLVLNKHLILMCLFAAVFCCTNNTIYAQGSHDWGGTGNGGSGNGGGGK